MVKNGGFFILPIVLIGYVTSTVSGDSLADAFMAHKAAVDAIDTIYLRFKINTELHVPGLASFAPPGEVNGEYWRDHELERITYSGTGGQESVYRTSETVTTVSDGFDAKSHAPLSLATIVPSGSPVFLTVSPWRQSLFALDSQKGTGTASLAEHIQSLPGKATYKLIDGRAVITCAKGAVVVQLEPRYNFLVRSKTIVQEGVKGPNKKDPARLECHETIISYKEVAPGTYFPEKVESEQILGGETEFKKTVIFYAVVVNQAIDHAVFSPRYQNGTLVHDTIRSTEYRVNASGERQGPETDAVKIAVGPPPTVAQDDPLRTSTTQTSEEPRRWGWWLAPLGGVLIALAIAIVIRRRMRTLA